MESREPYNMPNPDYPLKRRDLINDQWYENHKGKIGQFRNREIYYTHFRLNNRILFYNREFRKKTENHHFDISNDYSFRLVPEQIMSNMTKKAMVEAAVKAGAQTGSDVISYVEREFKTTISQGTVGPYLAEIRKNRRENGNPKPVTKQPDEKGIIVRTTGNDDYTLSEIIDFKGTIDYYGGMEKFEQMLSAYKQLQIMLQDC